MRYFIFLVVALQVFVGCNDRSSSPTDGTKSHRGSSSTTRSGLEPSSTTEASAGNVATIKETGQAVIEPGIFTTDCVYGAMHSNSDHAPVIYGSRSTWNTAAAVSDYEGIDPTGKKFFNHKFQIGSNNGLVDEDGNPVFPGGMTAEISKSARNPNRYYEMRLKRIADKIKELFVRDNLSYMALQEIPVYEELDENGVNLRDRFAELLRPLVLKPAPKWSKKKPSVALVVKAPNPLRAGIFDDALRFQSYCDRGAKECVVSAHMPFSNTDQDRKIRCGEIEAFIKRLYGEGFDKIDILGDFNDSAENLKRVCTSWSIKPPTMEIAPESSSCGDNKGHLNSKNIDFVMEFRK